MTDGLPRGFPHVLLRIKVGRCNGQQHEFQAWVGAQHLTDGSTTMPRSTIPEQQDRYVGMCGQQVLQMRSRRFRRQGLRLHSVDVASPQVERAIEGRFGAACVCRYHRGVSAWCPHTRHGRLQVQRRFIHCENHGVWRVLSHINQFFSSCSSKAMTCGSLRDLKTFWVR